MSPHENDRTNRERAHRNRRIMDTKRLFLQETNEQPMRNANKTRDGTSTASTFSSRTERAVLNVKPLKLWTSTPRARIPCILVLWCAGIEEQAAGELDCLA